MVSLQLVLKNRFVETMYSSFNPIANKTCDGELWPEVHADPADAHIPYESKYKRSCSASTPLNEKLALPGNLSNLSPFNLEHSILLSISEI